MKIAGWGTPFEKTPKNKKKRMPNCKKKHRVFLMILPSAGPVPKPILETRSVIQDPIRGLKNKK
jgi:hypothetical protein